MEEIQQCNEALEQRDIYIEELKDRYFEISQYNIDLESKVGLLQQQIFDINNQNQEKNGDEVNYYLS